MNGPYAVKVKLTHERDTKHKSVYSDDADLFGTIYLDSNALKQRNGGKVPTKITLTITGME